MAPKRKTWIWIVASILGVGVLCVIAVAGFGFYFISHNVKAGHATSADAFRAFDEARVRFKDATPLFELDRREEPKMTRRLEDLPVGATRADMMYILAWDPDTLFLTHFGPFHGVRPHFQGMLENLDSWSRIVRRLIANGNLDDAQKRQAFIEEAVTDIKRRIGEQEAEQYGRAGRLDFSWQGLSRYWKKKVGM